MSCQQGGDDFQSAAVKAVFQGGMNGKRRVGDAKLLDRQFWTSAYEFADQRD